MNAYKITTDDTLRETMQHGNRNYPEITAFLSTVESFIVLKQKAAP